MDLNAATILAFDSAGEDVVGKLMRARRRQAAREDEERVLRCVGCGHVITRPVSRTTVYGEHEHVRTNPFGLTFRLGCFAEAPGCVLTGPPTSGDTWFAGYRWRVAVCGNCQQHIGWRFSGSGPTFYGLVLEYLRE